ncbi:MAG: tyrosine-type recombinase/integrase [Labilithrix sp.]|nr:tyrosine-type recombinase/integrase [Labilithrix sp.]
MDEQRAEDAFRILNEEKDRIRTGTVGAVASIPIWKSFAASVFQAKVDDGTISSASGRKKWSRILEHHLFVPKWSLYFVDKVTHADLTAWRNSLPKRTWKRVRKNKKTGETKVIASGEYAPNTMNDMLNIARVIWAQATLTHELPRNPMLGIKDFPTDTHRTYTVEEPNSLTTDEVSLWLRTFKELFPQFYAMVFLGLMLGQRPSTLRPLRRQGPTPDLDFATRLLQIRRSHTADDGEEVMDRTKTKKDQTIRLTAAVTDVLKWHVDTQLRTKAQKESELLFPTEEGGIRSRSCLDKPFAAVTKACGITKKVTPRAMRRTFKDLSREANLNAVVAKAISGHQTDAMHLLYSTAQDAEIEKGLAKVVSIATRRRPTTKKAQKSA